MHIIKLKRFSYANQNIHNSFSEEEKNEEVNMLYSAAAYIMTDSGPGAVATCPNTYTSDCQRHVPNLIRSTKETTDAFS